MAAWITKPGSFDILPLKGYNDWRKLYTQGFWDILFERGVKYVTRIIVEDNESFESALRRFKKKVQEDRILSEIRRRRFFEKPSMIRKRKRAAKRRKSRRNTRRRRP